MGHRRRQSVELDVSRDQFMLMGEKDPELVAKVVAFAARAR